MSRSKRFILLGAGLCAALLASFAFADNRGVSFTPIGFVSNPGPNPRSSVWEMNPEGTQFLVSPNTGSYYFNWTREGGWGSAIGNNTGSIRLSTGGTVMGNGIYPGSNPAFLFGGTWLGTVDSWSPLPTQPGYVPCGGSRLQLYDMGGEGDYATGLTWQGCAIARAFKWDRATNTTVDLGAPNNRSTRGNAITADGSKVVGFGTALFGTRRGAKFEGGTAQFLGDPAGLEPKTCAVSGKACTSNSADPTFGCPGVYVDDGSCPNASKGTCVTGVCVGGFDAGHTCTNSGQCGGTCLGGPSNGARCTSNGNCPDTNVCLANPAWTDSLFKGEAYDMTPDGQYASGRNFEYQSTPTPTKWLSGYRANPDGTYTEIPPPATWPYITDPFRISDDGSTAVGRAGDFFSGVAAMFWREGIGTVDLQLFLVAQGLDELYFWDIAQANAVSANGKIIAGYGFNPDGRLEGWIIDISKVWICHAPPGNPDQARTLGMDIDSVPDHLAHGDFLGTCEFANSGALSRAADVRHDLALQHVNQLLPTPFEDPTTPVKVKKVKETTKRLMSAKD